MTRDQMLEQRRRKQAAEIMRNVIVPQQAAKVARAEKALIELLYTPKRDWRSRDWI